MCNIITSNVTGNSGAEILKEKLYIGIDFHEKNYIVTCICDEGV